MKCSQAEVMAEAIADEQRPKKKLSRRGFLQILGIGGAGVALPEVVRWGVEQLADRQDQIASLALAAEVRSGAFGMEKIGKIRSLTELRDSLMSIHQELSGISEAQIMIADEKDKTSVQVNTEAEDFFPASVIKVPICYEAWKTGQKMGKTFLTPELADQILRRSYTFKDLVMQLPIAEGRSLDQLELVVRDILENAGIPPTNNSGELPLRVRLRDLFGYLETMKLPQVMRVPLRQTEAGREENYGVSTVLLDTIGESVPAFFKIGLIYDKAKDPKELVNSYFFQLGDTFKTVGYAKGPEVDDVHEAMLHTAGRIASFVINKPQS